MGIKNNFLIVASKCSPTFHILMDDESRSGLAGCSTLTACLDLKPPLHSALCDVLYCKSQCS